MSQQYGHYVMSCKCVVVPNISYLEGKCGLATVSGLVCVKPVGVAVILCCCYVVGCLNGSLNQQQ